MQDTKDDRTGGARFLLVFAGFIIVVAGLREASQLLLPFVVSVFLAMLSLPLLYWLRSKSVPAGVAVITTVLTAIAALVLVGVMVGGSANSFVQELPKYEERLTEMANDRLAWLAEKGVPVSRLNTFDLIDPGAAMRFVGGTLQGITALLSNAFLVLLTTTFILVEAASLPEKLKRAFKGGSVDLGRFAGVTREVQNYVAIKMLLSLITGVAVAVWTAVLGVDFPVLWGMIAFVLNFIPNLGSIIAAVPAVLLAAIQLGIGTAGLVGLGYIVVNIVLGSVVEPQLMGRQLGLSPLIVFLSLVFWGWVWGPVGMLLSVPLTMIVKIMLEHTEDLRWVAVLLGSGPPQAEPEPAPVAASST